MLELYMLNSHSISYFIKICFVSLLITSLFGCDTSSQHQKKIGIIIPIQHKAMDEIVAGFEETLRAHSHEPLQFQVMNAQSDMNMQRAIISQMKNTHTDLIVPIGTDATEMSVAMINQQPIVSLASSFSQQDRDKRKNCNIAVVHDEISTDQIFDFIQLVYPHIKKITLIHSTSDKVFPEVKAAIQAGKNRGITVKPIMVPTLQELYSVSQSLPSDTDAIFVLKDSLIVSGISTLSLTAAKKHIPLITSDQGSVQDGAGFSLGVHEREIGVKGGLLASEILAGKNPCDLPIVNMTHLTVFVNTKALEQEHQSLVAIQAAAKQKNYPVEITETKSHD